MKIKHIALMLLTLITSVYSQYAHSQNINYDAYVYRFQSNQFSGAGRQFDCSESGTKEYTRKAWLGENSLFSNTTYSGCITCNSTTDCTTNGNWARRTRNNVSATGLVLRIDAWEDDRGGRCDYNPPSSLGPNGDDCRAQLSTTTMLSNPLEYTSKTLNFQTGNADHVAYARCTYRYATTNLANAVDNGSYPYITGGTRGFWGSMGNWSNIGGDCATSGTITHNQTSSFSTTVSCVDQVSFKWRVSSEANFDFLELYVDGARVDRISGSIGWITKTISLDPSFNHTIEWRYTKDGSVSVDLDRGFVDNISYRDYNAPAVSYGSNRWNVLAYNGRDINLVGTTYRGYYDAGTDLGINTEFRWNPSQSPSHASGYIGCAVTVDNHTVVHKRRGFPCGQYAISIIDHDDEIRIYVDGVIVADYTGCCSRYDNVWTGVLNASSTVEVRTGEAGGGSRTKVWLRNISPTLAGGTITSDQAVCVGSTANLLTSTGAGAGIGNLAYQWQKSENASNWTNVASAIATTYQPSSLTETTYYRRRITDQCSRVAYSNTAEIEIQTLSTTPVPSVIVGTKCPNSNTTLTASGGTQGTGADLYWYTDDQGDDLAGTGSPTVTPLETTTYYVRREGTCNTTDFAQVTLNVNAPVYSSTGQDVSTGYCTDNDGWHHFLNASGNIILSLQGDLSGATQAPEITISTNGTFYETTVGAQGSCSDGLNPGEKRFELPRSWDVNFVGTLNPPYNVRYYFPASDKTALTNAAKAVINDNPDCGYTYKYPDNTDGFYWFKNQGTSYVAPQFDGLHLTASGGNFNGINYSEMTNITSFSGGTGGIILVPNGILPIELIDFSGKNQGLTNTIYWATASELNNSHFEIEHRSESSEEFEVIARIEGAHTTNETQNYLYIDKLPTVGTNYYRLKQVDFDGTVSYSDLITLDVDNEEGTLCYPNPVQNNMMIDVEATIDKVELFDLKMQKVLEVINPANDSVDLSSLVTGMYLVKISTQEGVFTTKVYKE
ncbi:MAG: T9SS type A sorting domain-containing protein [Cytophagales bacterium]|nr:T9SS type A sorting domain-containing protein [Cytophagales bacterium]